jgi:hypothetical protein
MKIPSNLPAKGKKAPLARGFESITIGKYK